MTNSESVVTENQNQQHKPSLELVPIMVTAQVRSRPQVYFYIHVLCHSKTITRQETSDVRRCCQATAGLAPFLAVSCTLSPRPHIRTNNTCHETQTSSESPKYPPQTLEAMTQDLDLLGPSQLSFLLLRIQHLDWNPGRQYAGG